MTIITRGSALGLAKLFSDLFVKTRLNIHAPRLCKANKNKDSQGHQSCQFGSLKWQRRGGWGKVNEQWFQRFSNYECLQPRSQTPQYNSVSLLNWRGQFCLWKEGSFLSFFLFSFCGNSQECDVLIELYKNQTAVWWMFLRNKIKTMIIFVFRKCTNQHFNKIKTAFNFAKLEIYFNTN